MVKGKFEIGFIVLLIIGFAAWSFYYYGSVSKVYDLNSCESACMKKGYADGRCSWPREVENLEVENIGSCLIPNSKHCGNEGQCNCYCYNEKLIGGCGGVHPDYHQECCDRWAEENGIIKPACIGKWEVIEGECSWKCTAEEIEEECIDGEKKKYTCGDGFQVDWCECIDEKWLCILSPESNCVGHGLCYEDSDCEVGKICVDNRCA